MSTVQGHGNHYSPPFGSKPAVNSPEEPPKPGIKPRQNSWGSKPSYLKRLPAPDPPSKESRPPMELPSEDKDGVSKPHRRKIDQAVYARHKEQFLSDVMLLPEFVDEYSKQLPVQIRVLRGYCGPSSRLTISTDDMFNIHLVKRAKVIRLSDSHGIIYSVPLNSSIEFGLVFNPTEAMPSGNDPIAGFKLRVSDMLKLAALPKVICCLKAWMSEDGKIVLEDCEKLVVRGVLKVRMKSKKMLKVFSLRSKQEILLSEDCTAVFSTESSLVKMLLVDIMEYIQKPFPCGAMIHLTAEVYQNPSTSKRVHDIPTILLSRAVDITEVIVETSLIASNVVDVPAAYLEDCTEEELNQMIDIPLEGGLLDVEVAVVKPKSDTDRLYEDTRSIYEKFTPHKVKPLRNLTCDRAAAAQFVFSTAVRTGWETHGVELDEPAYTYLDFASFKKKGLTSSSTKGSKEKSGRSLSEEYGRGHPLSTVATKRGGEEKTAAPKLPPRRGSSLIQDSTTPPFRDVPSTPPFREVPSPQLREVPSTPPIREVPSMPPIRDIPPPPPLPNDEDTSREERQKTEEAKKNFTLPRNFETMESGVMSVTAPKNRYQPLKLAKEPPPIRGSKGSLYESVREESLSSSGCGSYDDMVFTGGRDSPVGGEMGERLARMEERLNAMESSIAALKEEMEREKEQNQRNTNSWKNSINEKLKVLEEQVKKSWSGKVAPPIPPPPLPSPPSQDSHWGSSVEENEEYLKKMSFRHVIDLLEAMELSKYAETFRQEQVSGDVLLELTEEELKEDLGIASKLHRIRLLKVISCKHSAKNILAGVDPYS